MVLLEEVGLRVQVVVNDVAAEEFPAPEQPDVADEDLEFYPFIRERYIESEAGVEFSISFAVLDTHGLLKAWVEADRNHAIALRISIDGQLVHRGSFRCLSKDRKLRGIIGHTNNMIQKFQFAAIVPIEDATKELETVHKEQTKDLGIIQVHIHRVELTKSVQRPPAFCGLAQGDEIALAQKALKGRALVHGASLASTSHLMPNGAIRRRLPKQATWMDLPDEPFAIIRFMYRSKDALKQELIIPQTPSPEPGPSPDPQTVDNLSPEQVRRLAQERPSEIQDRQRAARVKREEGEAE